MTVLIIPTYNRPKSLKRLFLFLKYQDVLVDIIIADSSNNKHFRKNMEHIAEFNKKLNISHIDCRNMDLASKLVHALEISNSTTICFCGDDDFPITTQILTCSKFLESNPDYSHSHGKIIQFECNKFNLLPFTYRYYPQREYYSDSAYDRLINHFKMYTTSWYSVHRRDNLLKNMKYINSLSIGFALKERLFSALDLLDGKRKMFNDIFMIRQKGNTLFDEDGVGTLPECKKKGDEFVNEIRRGYSEYEQIIRNKIIDNSSQKITEEKLDALSAILSQDDSEWTKRKFRSRSIIKPNISVNTQVRKIIKRELHSLSVFNRLTKNDKYYLKCLNDTYKLYK